MKTQVAIDITDWVQELLDAEVMIVSEETIFELTREGYGAGEIARMLVAARENGLAPEDILKPNKLLLYGGARREVAYKHEQRMLADRPRVREFIGRSVGDGDEDGYTDTMSEQGRQLAEAYLLNRVPGHVVNHLRIIAANGGDAEAVLARFLARVREAASEDGPDLA